MTSSPANLHYITHTPKKAAGSALLVLLHGYGSNETDLIGLTEQFDERLLGISVRAPHVLDTGGFAWFPIGMGPDGIEIDTGAAQAACGHLVALLDALRSEHVGKQIFLLGFSQGASMAMNVVLSRPRLCSGAVALSGVCVEQMLPSDPTQVAGLPLLMTHGRWDAVIPISQARSSRNLLQPLPLQYTYTEFDMGHEINPACVELVRQWFGELLAA